MSSFDFKNLPEGWTSDRIDNVCDVNPRLNKSEIPDDLLVSFVPMPAVGAGDGSIDVSHERPAIEVKKGFTAFQQGDVLFAKITPCMENGKMVVVPKVANGYGFGSTEFHVLRPKEGVQSRYVYYYVSSQNFRGVAERYMTGAVGQKRVSTTYLKEQEIPLAPMAQQTRIVAEIEKQFSRLDEAVANLKRVKANLKRYKAAVLKAAVEGKLTEEWRKNNPDVEPADKLLERILDERRKAAGKGKYKEPVAPDTSGLPELPAGWVWASLETISDALGGYAFKSGDFCTSGSQVVKMGNIKMGRLDLSQNPSFIVNVTEEIVKRYKLHDGDILVTLTGTKNKGDYGYVVQVKRPDNVLLLNQRIARLRFFLPECSLFTLIALQGDDYRNRFFRHETGNVGQGNVGIKAVTIEPVPIPPLAEQHQIVAEVERRLSIVAESEAQVDANLRRADCLRQSILKQAFSGQLVPQDENDEPASEMLDRIQNDVGANNHSPQTTPKTQKRAQKRANINSPLRKPQQSPAPEPLPMVAETTATYGDAITARILAVMQPDREYARADLVELLGLTTGQWNAAILELKLRGQVQKVEEKRGARYELVRAEGGGR